MPTATAAVGARTSSAVKRAGSGGVVFGNAAVTMTAAPNTASSAVRRNLLYRTALYAAKITAANVTDVASLCVASTAAKITQNAVTGYRRRNASGAAVSATPSRTQTGGTGGGATAIFSGCGHPGIMTVPDSPPSRDCTITAPTAAIVAATAMTVSRYRAGRNKRPSAFTPPLSLAVSR